MRAGGKSRLLLAVACAALFLAVGGQKPKGSTLPTSRDWRVHQRYIMDCGSWEQLVKVTEQYAAAVMAGSKNPAVTYGLWASWRLFWGRSDLKKPLPNINWGRSEKGLQVQIGTRSFMEDVVRKLFKEGGSQAQYVVAYAQHVDVFRERGLPEPKVLRKGMTTTTLPNGTKERSEIWYMAPDLAKRKRVAELLEKARRLDPDNPYVLLYQANRTKEASRRYALYKRAWDAGGKEFFTVECLRGMEAAAKALKSDEHLTQVKKLQESSAAWKSPFWQRYFADYTTVDVRSGRVRLGN